MGLHPRRFADRVVLPATVGELAPPPNQFTSRVLTFGGP
jgi:hypothetical protein